MPYFAKALALLASAGAAAASIIYPRELQTVGRAVDPLDAIGTFTSIFQTTAVCASVIRHNATAFGQPPRIAHTVMSMNGDQCQARGGMSIFLDANEARNSVAASAGEGADVDAVNSIIDAVVAAGEPAIYGVEQNGRACGGAPAQNLSPGSLIVLFTPDELISISLFPFPAGRRYMIVDDPGQPGICVYSAELRPTPEVVPSETPMPTDDEGPPVTPPITQPPATQGPGPTGSVAPTPTPDDTDDPTITPSPGDGDGEGPTVSPTATDTNDDDGEDDDDPVCFPADASVELEDGSTKKMVNVEIGDRVKVGNGEYSDVFMFTHKNADIVYDFVSLETSSGAILTTTKSHYIYVNGEYAAASVAKVGDKLEMGDGTDTLITAVSIVKSTGLFNPQTTQGDIIVNSIRASTFTRAFEPIVAQSMLAPFRMMYGVLGWTTSLFDNGADKIMSVLPRGQPTL